jgi:2-hydroxy-3-keto-5-methylthiopentenyl-1-phosphate phosphatase
MSPRLIVCDFDGTVTARDTNSYLANTFAPAEQASLEGKLFSRELSLREVLSAQHGAITVGSDAVVEACLTIPLRPGFAELLEGARARGDRFVLLSSGFRQLIEPMLAHAGFEGVELVSNDLHYTEAGGSVTWRELPLCSICDEQCKRHDVALLRDQGEYDEVVFIGDGFSDRCGAEEADRIFALAGGALEDDLRERGRAFEQFRSLEDVASSLGSG